MRRDGLTAAGRFADWRSGAVEMFVWALRLAGWLGLASLAQSITSGPLPAFLWVALWLLTLGSAGGWVARIAPGRAVRRAAVLGAGLVVSCSLLVLVKGGGAFWLLPATLAWATSVALAAAAARDCAFSDGASGRMPVRAAAAGAFLTWICVGDIGDLHSLVPRLIGLVTGCGLLVALLLPRRLLAARDAAAPPDCSLPAWSGDCWRRPHRWPVGLASLAMLPMMCSLPWMVSLCRSDAASAETVLGVHLAAMFLPAALVARHGALAARAPLVCALLLALGAMVLWLAPGGGPWPVLVATHGTAWGVSWAVRSGGGSGSRPRLAPWRGSAMNAICCVALGVGVATGGLQTLRVWPVALGVVAVASLGVAWCFAASRGAAAPDLRSSRALRTTPPRPARRPGDRAPARRPAAAPG